MKTVETKGQLFCMHGSRPIDVLQLRKTYFTTYMQVLLHGSETCPLAEYLRSKMLAADLHLRWLRVTKNRMGNEIIREEMSAKPRKLSDTIHWMRGEGKITEKCIAVVTIGRRLIYL
jgi:hypothetical protein